MAAMAIIGVSFSLATQGVRREHDFGLPKDRTLPLYLAVFVGIWLIGLAFVAVRELRVRYQRSYAAQRLPLGYVLATVTFLAVGGLAVTVLAVQISKQRASRPPLEQPKTEVRAVAPAALAAIGYIPGDCDLVAGFHVAEINDDQAVRDFLKSSSLIPGGSDMSFISHWTGLRAQEIDHAVLGLHIQGELIPRFTLVVRTLRSYDADALRKTLNASRSLGAGKREYYRVDSDKFARRVLWFLDDHTVVVGLKNEDLESVPAKPHDGIDHLPPEVSTIVKERLGAGTPAWIVGRPENWGTQLDLLSNFWKQQAQVLDLLRQVRRFGVWFHFTDGLTLNAAFECADAASAEGLEAHLTGHDEGEKKAFSLRPPVPELESVYQELGKSVKADRNGAWLALQARASAETLRKALAPK
jgi:hypothetical protein